MAKRKAGTVRGLGKPWSVWWRDHASFVHVRGVATLEVAREFLAALQKEVAQCGIQAGTKPRPWL